jgi:glycosyltransferase involved in cell wall biosynthesis
VSIINIFSPCWEIEDSYGRIAIELTGVFQANGYHVNQFGGDAPDNQVIRPAFGGILLGYPTLYKDYGLFAQVGTRIAITMFESTKLLKGWSENLNKCTAVILPATFLRDIFRENGVTVPLHVHPLGVSSEFLTPIARQGKQAPFTFLAIADRGNRKAWKKVLFAFVRAFGDDMRYRLILKARKFQYGITNPNVVQIGEDYSNEQMAELYRQSHVMVFPSCGEGFGLPPREFAATGGVAMTTNWGGTADDIGEWAVSLPYSMCDAWGDKPEWYGRLGQWADVDIDLLANQMKLVADNFQPYAICGMDAAEFVRRTYRWEMFGHSVINLWESEIENASTRQRSYINTA